jgi:cell division protein FtsW (lipid II flippase)
MELFDNLASVGFTTRVLQFIIVAGILIFLVGLYWRYIVVGAGILFCVVVFAMPTSKPVEVTKVEQKVELPEVKQIEPAPPVAEVKPETKEQADERMFLEDCNLHSGYTPSQCKALWESNKDEIQKSNWKYKNNKAYMKKVKNGI